MRSGRLCALLWRILTWCCRKQVTLNSLTYSRLTECHTRQAILARPDHPERMDPPSRGLPVSMLLVAPASSGPVYW